MDKPQIVTKEFINRCYSINSILLNMKQCLLHFIYNSKIYLFFLNFASIITLLVGSILLSTKSIKLNQFGYFVIVYSSINFFVLLCKLSILFWNYEAKTDEPHITVRRFSVNPVNKRHDLNSQNVCYQRESICSDNLPVGLAESMLREMAKNGEFVLSNMDSYEYLSDSPFIDDDEGYISVEEIDFE